ncbi:hypothetical protein EW145_g4985 [Phellinidium pouzarii]|uniref:Uncharacterized protein n=1 Tax=Phellinidium pouzarii TaxID=167371 RepID=A0A4S4L265_9AGAM|nr:hypothetical protein EW145_g4985 [Phellinidium pouzarii]
MPAALAIIHEVERRFGKIREFKLVQDKDMPMEYMPFIFVNFANINSVNLIRDPGDMSLSFSVVPWNTAGYIDGGIALEDIKDYLRPTHIEDDASLSETVSKVEDVLNIKGLDEVVEKPISSTHSLHASLEEHYNEDVSLSGAVGKLKQPISPENHSHNDISLSDSLKSTEEPQGVAVNEKSRTEDDVAFQGVSIEEPISIKEPLEEQSEEQFHAALDGHPPNKDQSLSLSEEPSYPNSEENRSTVADLKKEIVYRFSIPEHNLVLNRKLARDLFPTQYVKNGKPTMPKEKRIRVARAFIEWGGFYPSYNFLNEFTNAEGKVTPDLDVDALIHAGEEHVAVDVADATPSDPEKAREHAVLVATRAMRASLIRQRVRLRDLGESDHGFVQREGRTVVAEWLPGHKPEQRDLVSKNLLKRNVEQPGEERAQEARESSVNTIQKKGADVEQKPKALSKAEEESWERLVAQIIPGSMPPAKSEATKPLSSTPTKRPQKKNPARTSLPFASAFQAPSPHAKSLTAPSHPVTKDEDESYSHSQAETSLHEKSQSSSRNELANNRARRQARKIEEEQRQQQESFKSKLLGWMRTGIR